MRLVGEIAGLIGLEPRDVRTTAAEVEAVCRRLFGAGYRIRSHPEVAAFASRRTEHARCIDAIAAHLGAPGAPLLPGEPAPGRDESRA